jgi:hypothetical protein
MLWDIAHAPRHQGAAAGVVQRDNISATGDSGRGKARRIEPTLARFAGAYALET